MWTRSQGPLSAKGGPNPIDNYPISWIMISVNLEFIKSIPTPELGWSHSFNQRLTVVNLAGSTCKQRL